MKINLIIISISSRIVSIQDTIKFATWHEVQDKSSVYYIYNMLRSVKVLWEMNSGMPVIEINDCIFRGTTSVWQYA